MTAEERMAYFQGEKRRNTVYNVKTKEKHWDLIFMKMKFFIAVALFILFLSLDYTGYKIHGIGSEEIIQEVTSDFQIETIWSLPDNFTL